MNAKSDKIHVHTKPFKTDGHRMQSVKTPQNRNSAVQTAEQWLNCDTTNRDHAKHVFLN